ncbi:tetraspanin-33-like isoform X2 [Glandiceps talaboti]
MARGPTCGHTLVKILLCIYDFFFWTVGTILLAIGIYAEVVKAEYNAVSNLMASPTIFLIIVGSVMWIMGFLGCIGTLRENLTLLKIYGSVIIVIVILEIMAGVTALVFKTHVRKFVASQVSDAIEYYYDDIDLQNGIDAMQLNLKCCGGFQYTDWNKNPYFSCDAPTRSACGVPYSCCKSTADDVINTQCGYGAQNLNRQEADETIFVRGCVDAFILWCQDNLDIMGGICLGVVIPQLLGIILCYLFINAIREERDRYLYSSQRSQMM